jgi:plasmid stability protein
MSEQLTKSLRIDLPEDWHKKLKLMAVREGRTMREIICHALRPIVKSGKSGMNGTAPEK